MEFKPGAANLKAHRSSLGLFAILGLWNSWFALISAMKILIPPNIITKGFSFSPGLYVFHLN